MNPTSPLSSSCTSSSHGHGQADVVGWMPGMTSNDLGAAGDAGWMPGLTATMDTPCAAWGRGCSGHADSHESETCGWQASAEFQWNAACGCGQAGCGANQSDVGIFAVQEPEEDVAQLLWNEDNSPELMGLLPPDGLWSPFVEVYDAHAHNFGAEQDDWFWTQVATWATGTDTWVRMERLQSLKTVGVEKMVISGMLDDHLLDTDGVTKTGVDFDHLNDMTEWMVAQDPDFFVPLVAVDPSWVATGDAATEAEKYLAAGFKGVGEIWVHGHEASWDFDEYNNELVYILQTAASYDVPVMLHWDIGQIDSNGRDADLGRTGYDNYEQLIQILNVVAPNVPLPRVVIAHCGAGGDPSILSAYQKIEFQNRIGTLLRDYPNVYFDLGGTQIDGPNKDVLQLLDSADAPTELGEWILKWIRRYPTRFFLGTDSENRYDTEQEFPKGSANYWFGVDAYQASVDNYRTFLSRGAFGFITDYRVRYANAADLYGT